jgi:hypothetical protein
MLQEPEEDGAPLLDHLLAIERKTGKRPQILVDAPPLPVGCEDLWRIFNELHACRASNGFGPTRIGFVELDAYQRLKGVRLDTWEIECLQKADLAFLAHWKPKPQT